MRERKHVLLRSVCLSDVQPLIQVPYQAFETSTGNATLIVPIAAHLLQFGFELFDTFLLLSNQAF